MRAAFLAVLLLADAAPATAIAPFDLQCSKAFDAIAETNAGASWKGADKPRFCRCIGAASGGSADAIEAYNRGTASVKLDAAIWDCYERSDVTTKRR